MSDSFQVRVPASTSNLGSGFDTVSAALGLYLEISVEVTRSGRIEWVRGWDLPPEDNAVEQALRRTCDLYGIACPGLRLEMDNPIPLKRGLGSSGAALVAGIRIAERLGNKRLSRDQIFQAAYPLEGHPDNLSASLLGGWVLSRVDDAGMQALRLDHRLNCRFVLVIPEITVSTREARAILPEQYSRPDAVFNLQRCGLLVYSILAGRPELLREATQDRLHQPYRSRLVPGMTSLLARQSLPAELEESLLAVCISGSGSAMIALVTGREETVAGWMVQTLAAHQTRASYRILELDTEGARVV